MFLIDESVNISENCILDFYLIIGPDIWDNTRNTVASQQAGGLVQARIVLAF